MKRHKKILRRIPIGVAAGVVLVVGVGAGAAMGTVPTLLSPKGVYAEGAVPAPEPTYKTNANGQTFGTLAQSTSIDNEPDLILVEMENGDRGYALKSDLDAASGIEASNTFKSPEEAAAWQKKATLAAPLTTVPVYDSTGTKVIGEFVVGSEPQR
jgi:hypothetical protein